MRCSSKFTSYSCDVVCNKLLNCGVHRCTATCHDGDCNDCTIIQPQSCYCGTEIREGVCGDGTLDEESLNGEAPLVSKNQIIWHNAWQTCLESPQASPTRLYGVLLSLCLSLSACHAITIVTQYALFRLCRGAAANVFVRAAVRQGTELLAASVRKNMPPWRVQSVRARPFACDDVPVRQSDARAAGSSAPFMHGPRPCLQVTMQQKIRLRPQMRGHVPCWALPPLYGIS